MKGDHIEINCVHGCLDVKNVEVEGFETFHDEFQGGKRGNNYIYRFSMNGINYCHLGDLGHILDDDLINRIGEVDILFIPVGGVTTINADQAKRIISVIKPRIVVPMHYRISGLGLVLDNLENFLKDIPEELIYMVGNEIDFVPEDMVDEMEYWVFSM